LTKANVLGKVVSGEKRRQDMDSKMPGKKRPVIVLWMFGRYLSAQFFLCPKRSHLQIPLWKTSMSPDTSMVRRKIFPIEIILF